ncbi:UbiA prenyltransferase family protein [Candidatus Woesearchaeota archaeon]|nr:UbiA prenyltransferase family protein [Candidatus Woesearchaeota archaeon]
MGKLLDLIRLARPYQWYKNLVIFIAVFFSGNLFNLDLIALTTLGFISLCLVSSANYAINDIVDRNSDSKHPEKKKRPIASGRVGIATAIAEAALLLASGFMLAYLLSPRFFICAIALFILTMLYSMHMKNEPFADIMFIGTNFVLRALGGVFILNAGISPWLVICAFFAAIFLAVSKRKADLFIMGAKAAEHKKVLKYYPKSLLNSMINISATLLIISFSLYSFMKPHNSLLALLPFFLFIIFRYIYLVNSGSIIGRHPHLVYKDLRLVIAGAISGIIIFVVFYVF